jgi:hypothetical protein
MRRLYTVALALGCWWLAAPRAQEADAESGEGPDLEFLEYLGSWAEEDDEWLELEEWRKRDPQEADDRAEEAENENGDDDESE